MVNIQIRDVSEQVRVALTQAARSRGQSMQVYLKCLLEEEARRATNVALLDRLRAMGGGYAGAPGETARELDAIRGGRDLRNLGHA
jgi:hypothetical protein